MHRTTAGSMVHLTRQMTGSRTVDVACRTVTPRSHVTAHRPRVPWHRDGSPATGTMPLPFCRLDAVPGRL